MDAATALSSRLGVPAGFVPPPLPLAKKLPEGADALAHAARGLTRRLPQTTNCDCPRRIWMQCGAFSAVFC